MKTDVLGYLHATKPKINRSNNNGTQAGIKQRRASVAGASLFSVDGEIREYSTDYLEPVYRSGSMARNVVTEVEKHTEPTEHTTDAEVIVDSNDHIGENSSAELATSSNVVVGSVPVFLNSAIEAGVTDVTSINEAVATTKNGQTKNAAEVDWVNSTPGATQLIDPFRRTNEKIGFALYGRRRSISVMTSIREL